jgi:polysaccharide biosynthesis protein PslE
MIVEATPRSLLNVVFRHRVKFFAAVAFCLFVAAAYCLIATPKYKSTAELLVRFGSGQQQTRLGSGVTPEISAQQQERKEIVNSQIALLQSRDLLADILHTVGIARIYPNMTADTPPELENKAIDQLGRDLDAEGGKDSDIIDVSLLNGDANVAAETLRVAINKFQKREGSVYQSQQLPFLQDQLQQARTALTKSRNAVEAFKTGAGISSLDEERSLILHQRSDTRQKLVEQISTEQEAEQRYQRIEEALKKLPYEITLANEADRFKPVDDARERLSELRQREYEMSLNYRDNSVPIINLRKQIGNGEEELARLAKQGVARLRTGPNPVYQDLQKAALTAAGDEAAAAGARKPLEAELERLDARLDELGSKTGKLNELELQQQVDEENFRNYLQGVESARLVNDLNREGITSVAIVQEPTVPLKIAQPRVLIIMTIALLLGIALGLAVTFFSEMTDEAFSMPNQIESVIGVPVLAVFPQAAGAGQRS